MHDELLGADAHVDVVSCAECRRGVLERDSYRTKNGDFTCSPQCYEDHQIRYQRFLEGQINVVPIADGPVRCEHCKNWISRKQIREGRFHAQLASLAVLMVHEVCFPAWSQSCLQEE